MRVHLFGLFTSLFTKSVSQDWLFLDPSGKADPGEGLPGDPGDCDPEEGLPPGIKSIRESTLLPFIFCFRQCKTCKKKYRKSTERQ